MVHIDSTDVVVVLFVDEIDEIHGLVIEAEQTYPLFEIHVLVLDLFYKGTEESLHLLLEHEHFGDLCVGVLANDVL